MSNSLTDPHEIILFHTQWGKYPVTRRERYRLGILHGMTEAQARQVAYGGGEIQAGSVRPDAGRSYSADHLARLFDQDGRDRHARAPVPGMLPHAAAGAGA